VRRGKLAWLQAHRFGDQLVGTPTRLVVVRDRDDDDLFGAVFARQLLDLGTDFLRRADDRPAAGESAVRRLALAR
jgi:hypothetical protein